MVNVLTNHQNISIVIGNMLKLAWLQSLVQTVGILSGYKTFLIKFFFFAILMFQKHEKLMLSSKIVTANLSASEWKLIFFCPFLCRLNKHIFSKVSMSPETEILYNNSVKEGEKIQGRGKNFIFKVTNKLWTTTTTTKKDVIKQSPLLKPPRLRCWRH